MIKIVCDVSSYCKVKNAECSVFVMYSDQNFSEWNMLMFGVQTKKF